MHTNTNSGSSALFSTFPRPKRERWQPLRSGFVNLYRYDREEFHYENGRLLLRGNNGTGKSRVLALQLPFLLDGETIPQRLEPDADPAKRAEWNLLMGRYPDRTGYTWIEFGRRDADGQEHFTTLGCGLSAVEGQSGVRKWFFITALRMGIDFEVVSDGKQVLGKDRLRERIGAAGQVFEAAGAYRRAVNSALFRLDDYRYASFVNLLIQLRRPQLTRRLDEDELAGALSEALPPVSSAIIANVAEAFRSLESDRVKVESFKASMHAVDAFLTGYRRYAKVAGRRRVDRVRAAHYEYESGMKEILLSETDYDRSLAELASLKTEIQRLSIAQHALQSEVTTLEQSAEIQEAHVLEQASRWATEKRNEAEFAAAELTDAIRIRTTCAEEYVKTKAALEQRQARLEAAIEGLGPAASSVAFEDVHRELLGALEALQSADESVLHRFREKIEEAIQAQIGKTEHVRALSERITVTTNELRVDGGRRDQLAGLLDDARERLNAAHQEHNSAIADFLGVACNWRAGLAELRLPPLEALLSPLTEWCENPQESNPFYASVQEAIQEIEKNLLGDRTKLQVQLETRAIDLRQLKEERQQLASGDRLAAARRVGVPEIGAGSPLWRTCDFVDGLDAAARGGIEAALEAAGLLDAWITPSGGLVDPESLEAALITANAPLPPEDAHLGTILVPLATGDGEQEAPSYVVADILRHIGVKPNAGNTWITTEGQWQNGLLQGRSSKPAPEYIGRGARETARFARLAALDRTIAEAESRLEVVSTALDELNRRYDAAQWEAAAPPSDEAVRIAYQQAATAADEVDRLRNRLVETEEQLSQKQLSLDEALLNHDRAIADLGVVKWVDNLDSLEKGIANYRLLVASFWFTLEGVFDLRGSTESAWSRLEEAAAREGRQKEIADRLKSSAMSAEIAFNTLSQSSNVDSGRILERLDQTRRWLDDARAQEQEARRRYHDTELAVTRVDERLRNLTEMLNGQTERRNTAATSLRAFACTRLLHLAAPGIVDVDAESWSTTRTVEVAFELGSRLDLIESNDSAWEGYQKSVPTQFNELMKALSAQGCQPSATFRDDVFVATALFGGRERTMEELRHALAHEVTARKMLLDAREREILENHLVDEVSAHLRQLLNAAEEQVQQMNGELDSRPMSTGMKLRFVWRPVEDGPTGLIDVRDRLAQSSGAWSTTDRQMLGSFLQQQIQTTCSQIEGGSWQQSLAEALDYRKWHRFGLERRQDGVWKRLTRRTHGTGSGGEKAVALTLPHFAAAAAFYRTADPLAPRLILLDEAFVGIDADMRAKCMGLIHAFDLDFVMTSEREWGCYQTLPGLAIYQLSTRPGIDAISLTRWVWDGQQRSLNTNRPGSEEVSTLVASES